MSLANQIDSQIVFVLDNVEEYQTLSGWGSTTIIDSSKGALEQIAEYLRGESGISAIHLITHGSSGQINLGSTTLTNGNLNDHKEILA